MTLLIQMTYDVYMSRKSIFGIVAVSVIVTVLISFGLFTLLVKNGSPTDTLGASYTQSSVNNKLNNLAGFPVYYFSDDKPPAGISYVDGSAQFEQGVLFYSLTDSNGNKIVVSQQKVPEDLAGTTPQGDEKIETSYGNGGVSLLPDRTTVNIISDDSIFILINAPVAVNIDTVKTIARSLSN